MHEPHPAIREPIRQRIDYARVVASLAALDTSVTHEEIENLRGLCYALQLPPGATETLLKFAIEPNGEQVQEALEALRDSPLRFQLLQDLVQLAMSDGKYHIEERRRIRSIAAMLVINEEEVSQVEDAVANLIEGTVPIDVEEIIREPANTGGILLTLASLLGGLTVAAILFIVAGDGQLDATALELLGFGYGPAAGAGVLIGSALFFFVMLRFALGSLVGGDDR